jgi:hypothetical protein
MGRINWSTIFLPVKAMKDESSTLNSNSHFYASFSSPPSEFALRLIVIVVSMIEFEKKLSEKAPSRERAEGGGRGQERQVT